MNQNEEKEIHLTEFDYQFADPKLQMMKAAIPYMAPAQQRMLSMVIRFQELRQTMSVFSGEDVTAMGLSSNPSASASPLEMLQAIKPYAGSREREMIEMLENIQLMVQAMQNPT